MSQSDSTSRGPCPDEAGVAAPKGFLLPNWAVDSGTEFMPPPALRGGWGARLWCAVAPWLPLLLALAAIPLAISYGLELVKARQRTMFWLIAATYTVFTVWLPIYLVAVGGALLGFRRWKRTAARSARYRSLRAAATTALVLAFLGVAIRAYATHWEPYRLQVRELTLRSPHIHAPIRLLHISDIQSGGIGAYEERIVATVRHLDPDLIVHTGDLLQPVGAATMATELPKVRDLMATLAPRYGMYHVMGDVDRQAAQAIREIPWGMDVVESGERIIEAGPTRIRLLGLALAQGREGRFGGHVIRSWWETAGADDDAFMLIAGHAPDYVMWVNDLPIDLCLAGHTHGGQIRLPILGAIYWSSQIPRQMARGFHRLGATRINVSAGLGCEHAYGMPPIRFLCPPEMTLINLLPAE